MRVFYLRAHKELRASPLKPNVSTWMRSEKSLSFDVWCFNAAEKSKTCHFINKRKSRPALFTRYFWHSLSPSKLASSTPLPLSDTSTSSTPHSFSFTSATTCTRFNSTIQSCQKQKSIALDSPMLVAPASMLFSTSSLTAVAKVKTTCPEQIWCTEFLSIALMAPAGSGLKRRERKINDHLSFLFTLRHQGCWQIYTLHASKHQRNIRLHI